MASTSPIEAGRNRPIHMIRPASDAMRTVGLCAGTSAPTRRATRLRRAKMVRSPGRTSLEAARPVRPTGSPRPLSGPITPLVHRAQKRSVGLQRFRGAVVSALAAVVPGVQSWAGMLWAMGVFDRITIEPGKMGGQPCIRGHRFTVEHLLNLVGSGWTLEQIQEDFPFVEAADIQEAVAYASFSVREYHLPISRSA
jgi:uncharacterized protein (DUF433 family)